MCIRQGVEQALGRLRTDRIDIFHLHSCPLETLQREDLLAALDEVAEAHDAPVPTVALAWLAAQPTVAAPIASARTVEQLPALLGVAELSLMEEELGKLTRASA